MDGGTLVVVVDQPSSIGPPTPQTVGPGRQRSSIDWSWFVVAGSTVIGLFFLAVAGLGSYETVTGTGSVKTSITGGGAVALAVVIAMAFLFVAVKAREW